MRTHTPQACRAQDPSTCRHHGNPRVTGKLSFTQFFNLGKKPSRVVPVTLPEPYGLTIRDSDAQYREQILADIELNSKPHTDPKTGAKTVSIYRSGVPTPPTERGVEKDHYLFGDAHAPAGYQGRTTGVFASATMDTALRWYRANGSTYSHIEDYGLRELRVDPDTTRIYSVSNWERASSRLGSSNLRPDDPIYQAAIKKFWSESMTLTAWYQYVRDNPEMDTRDWEIITDVDSIKKVSPVGPKRMLDNCIRGYEKRDIEDTIKRAQAAKRAHKRVV